MLSTLLGIALITFGAGLSGSFSMPMTKVKGWEWEHSWLTYCAFAYLVFPLLASALFAPGFTTVLAAQPADILLRLFLLGAAYGVANLSFGLSLKYLGLSLGFSISLGLMMIFGTIIPPAIDGQLAVMLQGKGGMLLIAGLCVAVVGVGITALSGYLKEQNDGANNQDYNLAKGIAAALFVGITGSTQALAIEQGNSIAAALVDTGVNPLFQSVPGFIIIYAGSFLATLLWCLFATAKNGKLRLFVQLDGTKGILRSNYLFCSLAGFLWFINFVFYGMGKSRMGSFSFTAWGILMSMTIVCGTLWGIYRGEWKGARKRDKQTMYLGLLTLIIASFIIGMSTN